MKQDFFTYLPPEITIDILSRLPVRTAVSCKCVRKSWRSLIETPEFVKSYKSVPSLAVFQGPTNSIPYKVYELEDELNLENFKNPCNVAFNFSLPQSKFILSSANGLLLLADLILKSDDLAICNPVTRECINLPAPSLATREWRFWLGNFGFGVSKKTGQYKLVGIFHIGYDPEIDTPEGLLRLDNDYICQVYTFGTGLWRSIAHCEALKYRYDSAGVLLNGNIHWLAHGLRGYPWISCFDLESEVFSTSAPPFDAVNGGEGLDVFKSLFALRDCLGLCDNSRDQLVIWLMDSYGDGKSWTKQFVIAKTRPCRAMDRYMCVLKVFKDGDFMMKNFDRDYGIICCSNKKNTIQETDLIEPQSSHYPNRTCAVCYTPSFLRLETFAMENVSSF